MTRTTTQLFFSAMLCTLLFAVAAHAQINTTGKPVIDALGHTVLPLGTVSKVKPVACGQGFVAGANCYTAVVSCPAIADIGVTFGISSGSAGTIAFISGSGGTTPGTTSDIQTYQDRGFSIAQFAFDSAWEDAGGNMLAAACRPATMLDYFYVPQTNAPYCAQGISAGSSAVGYSLAWYGLDSELDNAELSVGPVFSSIPQGCEVPKASRVTVQPTNGQFFDDDPQYVGGEIGSLSRWTGQQCQPPSGSTPNVDADWLSQSVVQSSATLDYPNTTLAGWVCNNGLNPSAAQAYLFFSQVTSSWALTSLSKCTGAEGIDTAVTPQGAQAENAIESNMLAQCVSHHSHR